MWFERRSFWVAKDAGHPDEYQDAYALSAARRIAAIADGVSDSIFSGRWAQLLTRAVVTDRPDLQDTDGLTEWLAKPRADWQSGIDESQLAWHQKAKLRDGAFSTLLWVELAVGTEVGEAGVANSTDGMRLRCYSMGDCLLLVVRDGQLLSSFPMTSSAAFDTHPASLGSIAGPRDRQLRFEEIETGCQSGDLLVLCTDAVGAWALACYEAGSPPDWENYWEMDEPTWLAEIIEHRVAGKMRYDDTTLLMLRIGGNEIASAESSE